MNDQDLGEKLAARTLELCAIPSVTGNERAICDYVEKWARSLFPATQLRRIGDTLVLGDLSDPRPCIALAGHLDTVPPHAGDGPARREGDKVFGRGSSDMKSGDAVMMELAESLDRKGLAYNLVFLFYAGEEGPYVSNGLGPVFDALPELKKVALAFCLESSTLELGVACMGTMHAQLTFTGKSAHSSRPWQGENAIQKAGPFLAELQARERKRVVIEGLEYFEVFSATVAHGGQARNVIPERFELNVNYRFAPNKTLEQAEQDVRALVAGRAQIEIVDRSPPGRVVANNPHFRRFIERTGAQFAALRQGWSDIARFGVHGIDAVNYGPGLSAMAHQAGEYVPVENLVKAYRAYEAFLRP